MSKILFAPVGALAGVLAGVISRRTFRRVWGLIDVREPPQPTQREATWPKLLAALALEGAVSRATRGGVDHAARAGFRFLTGFWPGEGGPRKP